MSFIIKCKEPPSCCADVQVSEIPAHGRLIDADALWWNKRYTFEFDNEAGEHIRKDFFWAEDVAAAPTIIPAEDKT